MPVTRSIESNSLSLPNSPQKSYTLTSHLPAQHEETNPINEKGSNKKSFDSSKKSNGTVQKSTTSTSSISQTNRRSTTSTMHDILPPMRGRSNTDVQYGTSPSNNLKQQQQNLGGSDNDNHHNQQRSQSPPSPKPKCMLPTTTSQPGYVTPSKLFNMMGYGLENQYLFMLAHYLYIIDCRSKEEFDESHIVTGIRLKSVFFFFRTIRF
jgi:hypothetical protein